MTNEMYNVKPVTYSNSKTVAKAVVPGSKSITNRALLLAAMAEGTSRIRGCLTSDDARHFLECLKTLGFPVKQVSDGGLGSNVEITGFGGRIPNKRAEIYVGSAGTAARFLVAMLAFSEGEYVVNSSQQMKKRPMQPLIEALRNAGARVECMEEEGHFPLKICGVADAARIPERFTVNIDKSSQFLSALLIAVGTLGKKAQIQVVGSHGLSYVDLTAQMMEAFGVTVTKQITDGQISYLFLGDGALRALDYEVEPDMSAAAYFYGMAAILGTTVTVKGIRRQMLQGDVAFLDVLKKMGCKVWELENKDVAVTGFCTHAAAVREADSAAGSDSGAESDSAAGSDRRPVLKGNLTVDMSAFSDQALTLSAIAPFADGPVTIKGIGHIRLQECDRIAAIAKNLTALGIRTEEKEDEVTIYPGIPCGSVIETFEDHRVAMSFALTGLLTPGVSILNPSCCKKTFAEYFTMLEHVTKQIEGNSI